MHKPKQIFALLFAALLWVQAIFGMDFGVPEAGTQEPEALLDLSDFASESVLEEPDFVPGCEEDENIRSEAEPGLQAENEFPEDVPQEPPVFFAGEESQSSFSSGEEDPFQDFFSEENLNEMEESSSEKVYVVTYPKIETEGGKKNLREELEKLRLSGDIKEEVVEGSTLPAMVESEDNSFTSIEDCGVYLRGLMKKRQSSITVNYKTNEAYDQENTYWADIIDESEKHTGVGKEGDYLLWSCRSFKGRIRYSGRNGYTFSYEIVYYPKFERKVVLHLDA